jgi:hypothetical protein
LGWNFAKGSLSGMITTSSWNKWVDIKISSDNCGMFTESDNSLIHVTSYLNCIEITIAWQRPQHWQGEQFGVDICLCFFSLSSWVVTYIDDSVLLYSLYNL